MKKIAQKYLCFSLLAKGKRFAILALLLIISCQKKLPDELLEEAFNVHIRDNGNEGDATDIEINYSQFGLDLIKNYRAFIVKSENANNHDFDFLMALGEAQYIDLAPNEVVPSRGKRLPIGFLDTDGDQILENVSYRAAVISLPVDPETHLPAIAYSTNDIILRTNNLISNFTPEIESGSGELAIDEQGTLIMASYDVISDLTSGDQSLSPVLNIMSTGETKNSDMLFQYLGGTDCDSEGNFYISNTSNGEILKYTPEGEFEIIEIEGIELHEPTGIFIDAQGIIFVADRRSGKIYRINKDGISSLYVEAKEGILGLTGDNEGNLYASINSEEGEIIRITTTGHVRAIARIPTYVDPFYRLPFHLWLGHLEYHNGILYVAGTSTHHIYTVSLGGEVTIFAGSGDKLIPYGDILTAEFNRPMGLAFSPDGKTLFVSGCEDTTPQHVQASYPSRVYKIELVE